MNFLKPFALFMLLATGFSYGQTSNINSGSQYHHLAGYMIDADNGKPLPWVSIGIPGKDIGTVSQEDGSFELKIRNENTHDSIYLSYVGYKTVTFDVSSFSSLLDSNSKIALSELPKTLSGVRVEANKMRLKTFGNKSESRRAVTSFVNNALGNELGTHIAIKNVPAILESFQCYIPNNTFEKASFRLNIYEVTGGMPGKKLNSENIIVEDLGQSGRITVDLHPYQIKVDSDIIVSLEWIKDLGYGHLSFSTSLTDSTIYYRKASMGDWKKTSAGAIAFNVDVLH